MDNQDIVRQFADRIIVARTMRNLTQKDLAKLADMPQSQISKLERGHTQDPGILTIQSIADALKIPMPFFFDPSLETFIAQLQKPLEQKLEEKTVTDLPEYLTQGIHLGVNRATGQDVAINRFDKTKFNNANMFVSGSSGAGKSYFVKSVLFQESQQAGKTSFVIDPQNEYKTLAEHLGGQFITLGIEEKTAKINVLDHRPWLKAELPLAAFIDYVIKWITILCKSVTTIGQGQDIPLSAIQQVILQKALTRLYKDSDEDTEYTLIDLYMMLQRIYVAKQNDAAINENIQPLLHVLSMCVGSGHFAELFDRPTTLDVQKGKMNVFATGNVSDEFRPVLMIMATKYIELCLAAPDHDMGSVTVVIDEFQRMMRIKDTAVIASDFVRVIRKFNASCIVVTQDLDMMLLRPDGLSPHPEGRAILNNCPTRILLRTEAHSIDLVVEVFRLSQNEGKAIANCSQGEGLLIIGHGNDIVWINAHRGDDDPLHGVFTWQ